MNYLLLLILSLSMQDIAFAEECTEADIPDFMKQDSPLTDDFPDIGDIEPDGDALQKVTDDDELEEADPPQTTSFDAWFAEVERNIQTAENQLELAKKTDPEKAMRELEHEEQDPEGLDKGSLEAETERKGFGVSNSGIRLNFSSHSTSSSGCTKTGSSDFEFGD